MKRTMMEAMPEHDRRRIGAMLNIVLDQLRADPDAMEKIRKRVEENRLKEREKSA